MHNVEGNRILKRFWIIRASRFNRATIESLDVRSHGQVSPDEHVTYPLYKADENRKKKAQKIEHCDHDIENIATYFSSTVLYDNGLG